jgi:CheY-like chemotaxis protein
MPRQQAAATDPARRRIVVVEDNAELRQMLAEFLQICGHQVQVAATGREALDVIAATATDVALVDIGLPDLDGYEVARRLRCNSAGRALRLVALTGHADEEDRRQALAAGFDEYLVKPIEAARLLASVSR